MSGAKEHGGATNKHQSTYAIWWKILRGNQEVCDEWRYNFQQFLHDMGPKPKMLTIQRIDENKTWDKGNCYWGSKRTPFGLGKSNRRIYDVWNGMKARCQNPNHVGYKDYGGRGIEVCESWQSFENFLKDMGDPGPGFSIERENVNGNCEPGNCRWATSTDQSLNTRRNRVISFNGETMPACMWADKLGIERKTLLRRLYLGWSDERALTTPVRNK